MSERKIFAIVSQIIIDKIEIIIIVIRGILLNGKEKGLGRGGRKKNLAKKEEEETLTLSTLSFFPNAIILLL